jgi:hypothetical protein
VRRRATKGRLNNDGKKELDYFDTIALQLVVPADQGYGAAGTSGIPGGARLLFDVTLHKIAFGSTTHKLCKYPHYRDLC